MGLNPRRVATSVAALLLFLAPLSSAQGPVDVAQGERFREANALVRGGDFPKAIGIYRELASSGAESASLYWNWAQAAAARGSVGEAMWALLRGRELEPGDKALGREIERVRQMANLDPAELSPEPMAVLARVSRRFHLALASLVLAGLSVLFHGLSRLLSGGRWPVPAAWTSLGLALALSSVPLLASLARPTGVVILREAPLIGSASPTAEVLGSLREAEVVPILEASGPYLRIEDSSGARGWVHATDVWPLDRPPVAGPG